MNFVLHIDSLLTVLCQLFNLCPLFLISSLLNLHLLGVNNISAFVAFAPSLKGGKFDLKKFVFSLFFLPKGSRGGDSSPFQLVCLYLPLVLSFLSAIKPYSPTV